ncbi:type I restriction enzyme S subunit [Plasticicumulans lactativorans]|uniref:Type I restriction enzyme S subunit n=1 Tax=Plasticicumulans lactativorans TaxID=1133106 RepID=A0A4V2SDA7_9GAMM|nr:restriction endonuclease subunit S [Plasticicumulans lactativorans]TCO82693.1 type I restriction enzyme S subunit [Plasticicumulans lactativorans]
MSDDEASLYRALSALVSPVDTKITVRKDPIKPYVGLENIPSRGAHLVGWAIASSSISTNAIFQAGDILFGKLRPNLRKCVVAPFDGYCSTDILVLRPNTGIDPSFAGKVLRTELVGAAAEMTSVGTKMPRTSWKHLSELGVFCPGFPEQSKIAQILDTLDTAIHETEAIIAKLKAVKQGLLHDLLTRGIDSNGELRPPQAEAPQLYKESPLGWIPKEWEIGPAATYCDRLTVGVVNTATHAYVPEGVPFIRSQNVRANQIMLEDLLHVTQRFNREQIKSVLREGDVVIVRTGYPGTAAVIPASLDGSNCFSLVVATPQRQRLNSSFLAQYMNAPMGQRQVSRLQFGSAQHNFNIGEMRILPVPRAPLPEQRAIVASVLQVDVRLTAEESWLKALRATALGVEEDLLTGRVRVTPLLEHAAS